MTERCEIKSHIYHRTAVSGDVKALKLSVMLIKTCYTHYNFSDYSIHSLQDFRMNG